MDEYDDDFYYYGSTGEKWTPTKEYSHNDQCEEALLQAYHSRDKEMFVKAAERTTSRVLVDCAISLASILGWGEELQRLFNITLLDINYKSVNNPFPCDAEDLIRDLNKVNVEAIDTTSRSFLDEALFSALAECRHEMAKILIARMGVEVWGKHNMTPLLYSYDYCNHPEEGKEVRNVIVEAMQKHTNKALKGRELLAAVKRGDVEIIEKLLKKRPEYCSMMVYIELAIGVAMGNALNDVTNIAATYIT